MPVSAATKFSKSSATSTKSASFSATHRDLNGIYYMPRIIISSKNGDASILKEIINPTLKTMNDLGYPYHGILYAGVIFTKKGIFLIEYNNLKTLVQELKELHLVNESSPPLQYS